MQVNMHNIIGAEVSLGQHSTVTLIDARGAEVRMFVLPDQALAIAAVFAPKVNEAGVPVFEGRAA